MKITNISPGQTSSSPWDLEELANDAITIRTFVRALKIRLDDGSDNGLDDNDVSVLILEISNGLDRLVENMDAVTADMLASRAGGEA